MRGEVWFPRRGAVFLRITPACAGRRVGRAVRTRSAVDHPRVRGEKAGAGRVRFLYYGSPPRARGEGTARFTSTACVRITPACAGRRLCGAGRRDLDRDHPRVRGEKLNFCSNHVFVVGSPPRARGEVQSQREEQIEVGITPACAGRSATHGTDAREPPDHPRVRGEKATYRKPLRRTLGSPPRARGEEHVAGGRA